MLNLLDEGTTSRNSIQIAEAQERLGAPDRHRRVARPHRRPADRADAQSRRRRSICSPTSSAIRPSPRPRSSGSAQQQLAGIASELTQPQRDRRCARCRRCSTAPAIPMAAVHRHRRPRPSVQALTRDDLVALPPDAGSGRTMRRSSSVGDLPLAELVPHARGALRQLGGARRAARAPRPSPRAVPGAARRASC